MIKPCRSCPSNKCSNCPVAIEYAAIKSAENHGAAEKMWIQDPKTGEMVLIDLQEITPEMMELLEGLFHSED